MNSVEASSQRYLVRTMSDTVETDIRRVHIVSNEILSRYEKQALSFEQLRKIADGPFDLFLIPIIFKEEFQENPHVVFNEQRRQEIRNHALEIARKHGFDANPPDLIPGVEASLRGTQAAGLVNVLMTTGGRRYKHRAMESHGLGSLFAEIIDRDQTYFTKEQGLYDLWRRHKDKNMEVILLSGTASYLKAGNNLESCVVGGGRLRVFTVALATDHSYNDEETLRAAKPKILMHSFDELLPRLREQGLLPGGLRLTQALPP